MKSKGFTLLELIIVIIILGVLATLGIQQYGRMVERSRGAEARAILGQIRKVAAGYRLEWGSLNAPSPPAPLFDALYAGMGVNPDQVPTACRPSHYFSYAFVPDPPADPVIAITATRCMAGGKTPDAAAADTVELQSALDTGIDTWISPTGY